MEDIPLPSDVLTIGELSDGTIGITVSQYWSDTEVGIAIQTGLDTCIITEDVLKGGSEELSATCLKGYAGLTVVVYFDPDFDPDKCEGCNVDDLSSIGGDYEFCAYRIEVPCDKEEVPCGEPSAEPSGSFYPSEAPSEAPTKSVSPSVAPTASPTASPTDSPTTATPSASPTDSCPESTAVLVSNEGETLYPENPIKIKMQNDTHVGFQVLNTFGKPVSSIFTQYHAGSFGETECVQEENVEIEAPIEYVAQCMHHTKISILNVWIQDCDESEELAFLDLLDNAEVPECCHPGEECKTVQYTFKIPCEDPCPPEEDGVADTTGSNRRLGTTQNVHEMIHKKKEEEASTNAFEELTGHADGNDADDHFCVVEDYPCGANLDKVHVCHYSARDGYKTFCVPEADSDALRFYPKDYCGPCVGGYSTV